MIIDFHTHIFSKDIKKNRENYFSDQSFAHIYSNPKSRIIDNIDLLNLMTEQNVDKSIIMGFAWNNESICKKENEYLLKAGEESSGKLIPIASVPNDFTLDVYSYIKNIKKDGFKGIGEIAFYNDWDNDEVYNYIDKIFRNAMENNLFVSIHMNELVGHFYSGKYETSFKNIYDIISRYPDLKIIMAHWGGGIFFYELMPEVKETFKNVYYDNSASPFLYEKNIYKVAKEIGITDKILFGSDYPLIKPERYIREMKETIDSIFIEKILSKNALKIL